MTDKRNLAFAIVLFPAPVAVAWLGLSVPAAVGLVLVMLLLRVLFPLQSFLIRYSFKTNDTGYGRAVERIEKTLAAADERLYESRPPAGGAP